MAHNPARAPSSLQPRPKAQPITNELNQAAVERITQEFAHIPPNSRQIDGQKQVGDTTSNKATATFIRRTLCSHQAASQPGLEKGRATPRPIEELLPPLTSSNEVDLQLYALISIIIKDFVQTWYSKITPDHVFIDEVVHIIAHCTRALEQRLREVDLESLVLDEIPELFAAHVSASRTSRSSCHSPPLVSNPREVYHILHPHPALSPVPLESNRASCLEQQKNEAAWRQLLVQGVLAVLLPTEDLENDCLRTLVGEIFSEMILGNGIGGKACESWLLWEAITNIVSTLKVRMTGPTATRPAQPVELSRDPAVNKKARSPTPTPGAVSVSTLFWKAAQFAFLALNVLRAIIVALATTSALQPRSPTATKTSALRYPPPIDDEQDAPGRVNLALEHESGHQSNQPILAMTVWSCVGNFIGLQWRMPWLYGFLSLMQWAMISGPGKVGDTNGALDKLLSHHITATLSNPALLPPLLLTVRTSLFPNNTLGPPRVPPTPAETLIIKRKCAETLLDAIPPVVARTYFATSDREAMRSIIEEEWLDVFSDAYCNKHLVYGSLELVLVRLIPELSERGVSELMEERLG